MKFRQGTSQEDEYGWKVVHHSLDCNYSWRAGKAVPQLIAKTSLEDLQKPVTGGRCSGRTALHLVCENSDVLFQRAWHAELLLRKKCDVDPRDAAGNTPFLLAAGTGLADVLKVLRKYGCDVHAVDGKGKGAWMKAQKSSSSVTKLLESFGCCTDSRPRAKSNEPKNPSMSKVIRLSQNLQHRGRPRASSLGRSAWTYQ